MVNGIEKFKEFFKDFTDKYVIIGGTACDMIISAEALTPRSTTDIDIILVVEALDPEFGKKFWEFIKAGTYEHKQHNDGERKYYRFLKPATAGFPKQLELFSKVPEILTVEEGMRFTVIPVGEELSSMSAILMDEDYYQYCITNSTDDNGLKRANTETLICLKAKAFLDLSERKKKGEDVSSKDIRKHKGDIFRLGTLLTEDDTFDLPDSIKKDLQIFMDLAANDMPDTGIFKELGMIGVKKDTPKIVFDQVVKSFGLTAGAVEQPVAV